MKKQQLPPGQQRKTNRIFITDLHVEQLNELAQERIGKEQMRDQIIKVNRKYESMRVKQKFINQLKIYIQSARLSKEELKANGFDFQSFEALLTSKAYLIYTLFVKNKGKGQDEKQFHRIDVQLSYLQRNINTKFITSLDYPIKELVQAKNSLISRSINKEIQQLEQRASNEKSKASQWKGETNDLKQLLFDKKKQLIQEENRQIIKNKQIDNHEPKDIQDHSHQQYSHIAHYNHQKYQTILQSQLDRLKQESRSLRARQSQLLKQSNIFLHPLKTKQKKSSLHPQDPPEIRNLRQQLAKLQHQCTLITLAKRKKQYVIN